MHAGRRMEISRPRKLGRGTMAVREERGLRAEKGPYLPVKLLRCSSSAQKACSGADVGLRRRRRTELGGEVEEEWLRTPGSHEELRRRAVRPVIGSVRSKRRWWCGIAVADPLTGGGPWREIPRVQGLRSCGEASGSLLALRQGRCAAPVGLGSSRATRPRRRSGSARRS